MNPWKIATFLLVVLLAITVVLWRQSAKAAADNADVIATQNAQIAVLNSAVDDTQAYLNWYSANRTDGLSAEDLERNIVILRNKYRRYFPDWANTQTE